MKLILHTCCAVCLGGVREVLEPDAEPVALFFNPNIHPLLEFRKRMRAIEVYFERDPVDHIVDGNYGLETFLDGVPKVKKDRCARCYRMRLERTAREAVRAGADAFATTLTVSRHQDHAVIREVAEDVSRAHGVPFYYRDWRPAHEAGVEKARRMSLYRQQYCGCIYSEAERFQGTSKELAGERNRCEPSKIGG